MKLNQILISFICFALLILLIGIVYARATYDEPIATDAAATVAVSGAGAGPDKNPAEPERVTTTCYEMYFTEDEAKAVARMLWGEARGCTKDNQIKCVWVICNRVDDNRFPDTVMEVVTQPSQFFGYSENFPVTDELYAVALDVLTRWSYERQGMPVRRELDRSYLWFTGDGTTNHFREVY